MFLYIIILNSLYACRYTYVHVYMHIYIYFIHCNIYGNILRIYLECKLHEAGVCPFFYSRYLINLAERTYNKLLHLVLKATIWIRDEK